MYTIMSTKVFSLPSRTKLSELWISHCPGSSPFHEPLCPQSGPAAQVKEAGCLRPPSPPPQALSLGMYFIESARKPSLSSEKENFCQRNVSVQLEKINYSTCYHIPWRGWSLVSVSRNQGSLFLLNIFALLVAKFSLLLVLCLGFCLGNLRSLGFEEGRSPLQPLLSPVLASQRWSGAGKEADLGLALPASSEVCRQQKAGRLLGLVHPPGSNEKKLVLSGPVHKWKTFPSSLTAEKVKRAQCERYVCVSICMVTLAT